MKLVQAFIGVPQSKYAAITILTAILTVCLVIIFSKDKIPLGQKLLIALVLFIVCIPSVLYILFQLTCIVTGGGEDTWWCNVFAWILLAVIVVYAVIVVVMAIISVSSDKSMLATEQFYSNKKKYEKFASDMITGGSMMSGDSTKEGYKQKHAVRSEEPLPTSSSYNLVDLNQPSSVGASSVVAAGSISGPTAGPLVQPTVEKFTSCGVAVPQQPAM